MRRNLYLLMAAFYLVAYSSHAAVLTVTTADNDSGPLDGQVSLLEALQDTRPGDTIAFNLPGAGPHAIVTPLGGYPFVTRDHVTIDGYTQPGAVPNTLGFADGNNARLQIILDSRSEEFLESADPEQPDMLVRRSTRMLLPDGSDISGYGRTENGILSVFGARNFTVRGICFLARHTAGNQSDPSIYCVALAKESVNAKVQGCWFGLHPDQITIAGARAAVTGFRHMESVNGQPQSRPSTGLVFGTDGDGINDRGERNLSMGMSIAIGIELPGARISGNYFNVFPDGSTFLDILTFCDDNGLSTLESFENGRHRENTLIGTDGNGVSDEEERNVFGPSRYDHVFEFYGGNVGTNVVIAGNHFGVGANGTSLYPFEAPGSPDFLQMAGAGSVRIGTDGDGISDRLEANRIYGLPGDELVDASLAVSVVARGNWMQNDGFIGFPFQNRGRGRDFDKYYAGVIPGPLESESDVMPDILDASDGFFSGTVPAPNLDQYPYSFLDLYLADPVRAQDGQPFPGSYLGTFVEGSTQDRNGSTAEFRFTLAPFDLPAGSEILAVVTYSKQPDQTEPDTAVTGPVSEPLVVPAASTATPIPAPRVTLRRIGDSVELLWSGLEGVFRLETTEDVRSTPWRPVFALAGGDAVSQVALPIESGGRFYRLSSP